jgi:hypothetical protein
MFAEVAYEDAYVAFTQIDAQLRGKSGLNNHEVVRAARKLGIELTPVRKYDLDDDEGVLRVRWSGPAGHPRTKTGGHWVAVKRGLILCPTYMEVVDWRDYLERNQGRACTLLKGHV